MSCLFGKAVSVAGGAGSGVAFAAGRHDDRMGIQLLSVGQRHTLHPSFADEQRVGTAVDQAAAQLTGFVHQRLHDVCRAVGHGKDPLASLDLERNTAFFKETHHFIRVQSI